MFSKQNIPQFAVGALVFVVVAGGAYWIGSISIYRDIDSTAKARNRAVFRHTEKTDGDAGHIPNNKVAGLDNERRCSYHPDMTPADVVRGYLSAKKWHERLPFVVDSVRVRPLMALHYRNIQLHPDSDKPGQISVIKSEKSSLNGAVMVNVDMTVSSSDTPNWKYLVVRTNKGYKIDWQASMKLAEEERDELQLQALGLKNAYVEVNVVKILQRSTYSTAGCVIQVRNLSNKHISYWSIDADALGANGKFLAHGLANGSNLRPGQLRTATISFLDLNSYVYSVRPMLDNISIYLGGGRTQAVGNHFSLRLGK